MASKESRSTITHFNQPIYIPNKLLKFEDIRLDEQKSRSPDEVATPTLVKQSECCIIYLLLQALSLI